MTPHEWIGSSGDPVRLICARASSHVAVIWSRSGNQQLSTSSNQRDGVLTIGNPDQPDSGVYICTATSDRGTETSTFANVTIVPRKPAMRIRVEPARQKVLQGTSAETRCIVENEGGLTIKWVKRGEALLGPNAQQIGNTLKINNPQVTDRGVYVCKASGTDGNFEATALIEVERKFSKIISL